MRRILEDSDGEDEFSRQLEDLDSHDEDDLQSGTYVYNAQDIPMLSVEEDLISIQQFIDINTQNVNAAIAQSGNITASDNDELECHPARSLSQPDEVNAGSSGLPADALQMSPADDLHMSPADSIFSAPHILQLSTEWQSEIRNLPRQVFTGYNEGKRQERLFSGQSDLWTIFTHIFDEDIIEFMVVETNRYALQTTVNDLRPNSRLRRWKPITGDEMRKFLGVYLLTKFALILKCWHFVDNEAPRNEGDRLYKIQPLIDKLTKNWRKIFTPEKCIVVDESMVGFRGRIIFRTYNPQKSHKYGIQIYKLCTDSGYTWSYRVYPGQDDQIAGLDKPGSVVGSRSASTCTAEGEGSITEGEKAHDDSFATMFEDGDETSLTSTAHTSTNQVTCLFCNRKQKKTGPKTVVLIISNDEKLLQQNIKNLAKTSNDSDLLSKLENYTVVYYHKPCYASYISKERRRTEEHTETEWHKYRNLHHLAFQSISNYVTKEVIENNKVFYFDQLYSRYQALLLEFADFEIQFEDIQDYRAEALEKKMLNTFGEQITIEASTGPRMKKIVYKTDIDVSIMVNNTKFLEMKNEKKYDDVAFDLRNTIKNVKKNPLPTNINVDDVIRGECEIPEKLIEFMQNLIEGPHTPTSELKKEASIKIKSICSDVMYAIHKGRCKPSKHLTLGLAIKSLTNSRQVITILNRYGHTIGYNLAEELETEITYTSLRNNKLIPTGITATEGCSTHVAFDNFDRFVDTTTGKDTMHDTVGIIYQFPSTNNDNIEDTEASTSTASARIDDEAECAPKRKRRRFEGIVREVRPYYSKPTTILNLLTVDNFTNIMEACRGATEIAIDKDLIWVLSLSRSNSVPMWLGYNCMTSSDHSEIQNIEYLPPINSSPTSYAIVNETLIMSKEIAEKCGQQNIIVTYDLAISKMAMQIQQKEQPKFDNIFINLGAFHMQMAFFKAIGKYIDSSGLVEILVQAEVLASGSMNSFLDSKHFNRCKRIHPLTAAALEIIHFEQYLTTTNTTSETFDELLETQRNSAANVLDVNERMPNYARWTIYYLSNLIKLYIENSPLITEFRRGAFGIRRTSAAFARSPVDLTLEQTINADASNELTDNLAADSISARQRWALSHSMRTKLLTITKEYLGLTAKDDTSNGQKHQTN
ncbi:unnamed protein product [Colias eurytheme]|nr:unnamed protein product [Colias eurytheme]